MPTESQWECENLVVMLSKILSIHSDTKWNSSLKNLPYSFHRYSRIRPVIILFTMANFGNNLKGQNRRQIT